MTRRSHAPGRRVIRPYVELGVLQSGAFEQPVFEFDRRLGALERAFYRHVLRTIDLDALFALEQQLWVRLADRGRLSDDQVLDLSNAIVQRAFERLGRDPVRAMQEGVLGPDGKVTPAPEAPHERCPFCDSDPENGDGDPDDSDDDPDDGTNGPDNGGGAPPAQVALAERACFTQAGAR